jgi:hypothetical protein
MRRHHAPTLKEIFSNDMDVRVKNYLPLFFIVLGVGLMIGGLYSVREKTLLFIGLFFIGLILSTTQYRLEINFDKKYYREYVWTLGLKWGEKIRFNQIQYLYLTKVKKSQVYGQTYKNHYVTGAHFNGYIKFSDNEKILIGDSSSKDWVLKRLKKINSRLRVEVKDYS